MAARSGSVVTLEFDVDDSNVFLIQASEKVQCEVTLEEIIRRSDGTILEFLTVRGAAPEKVIELAEQEEDIREARLITENESESLLEFVVAETRIASWLADNEAIFTQITAEAGHGEFVIRVPTHVDADAVVETFLANHPGSELVDRYKSDDVLPTFTEHEFRTQLVSDLTDRQLESLRVAYSNGYFAWPRECSTEDVADILGIAGPTVSQHLRVAEEKLLRTLFDDGAGGRVVGDGR